MAINIPIKETIKGLPQAFKTVQKKISSKLGFLTPSNPKEAVGLGMVPIKRADGSHSYVDITGAGISKSIKPAIGRLFKRAFSKGASKATLNRILGFSERSLKPVGTILKTPQQVSVEKLTNALKEVKSLRGVQEQLYTAERSKRLSKILNIRGKTSGEKGFHSEISQLKGSLPKVEFETLRGKIAQPDIDNLFNLVRDSTRLGEWEKITAREGLVKMFGKVGGEIPTTGQLKLLSQVFPKEVISTLLEKRPVLTRISEGVLKAVNIPRSLMSSFDLSAPLRQGIFFVGRKQFYTSFASMFKQFGSEKGYRAVMESIQSRPSYQLMRESKLALTDMDSLLGSREEAFMSNWAEKIPAVGRVVRASGRAYTGFLNKLRADVFDDLVMKAQKSGIEDLDTKSLAKFINNATGRGSIAGLEQTAQALNGVLFSPRLLMSRLQMLNPVFYVGLDPFVRKQALKSLLSFTSIALTVLGLAKMGGADVETDPRNTDFGKIRVDNTRFDILGGFQQYIRVASQLITGETISSTSGKKTVLGEGYKPTTKLDIAGRFVRGKLSPIASFVTDWMAGADMIGNKFEMTPELIERFTPMIITNLKETMKEEGYLRGAIENIPAVFGVGTQTYKDAPKTTTKRKSNRFNR